MVGVDYFPGIDQPTSRDRLGIELAREHLKLVHGLRRIRIERGMSVGDVAEAMGVDPAQVSRFESGSTNPTMTTIKRYAKAVEAVFRVSTRSWRDEQTQMVRRSFEAWESSYDERTKESSSSSSFRAAPQQYTAMT